MKPIRPIPFIALALLMLMTSVVSAKGVYLTQDEYLAEAFPEGGFEYKAFWVKGEVRETAEDILGHRFPGLRTRYWQQGERTAWVFDEIGKERPITIGVVVENQAIHAVRILEFRESRGWEVRYPFFTDQFVNVALTDRHKLNQHIDGISGATLSYYAVKKVARLALFLSGQVLETTE